MVAIGTKNNIEILRLSKPQITQADADEYYGSIDSLAIVGGATYTPAGPDQLAQLEAALDGRELLAKRAITRLKTHAAAVLVAGGMSEAAANAAGTALILQHSTLISAFKDAGGHPDAAQALLDAITASPPAWWSAPMEAIFAAGLGL